MNGKGMGVCGLNRYLEYHKSCGIKVGDTVRITRKATSGESGWNNSWMTDMDKHVGKEFKVVTDNREGGFELCTECDAGGFEFPHFVLEKTRPDGVAG